MEGLGAVEAVRAERSEPGLQGGGAFAAQQKGRSIDRRLLETLASGLAKGSIPAKRQEPRRWFRVHPRDSAAVLFSPDPSHRFSHADCPCALLYLATDVETCLWERFGEDIQRKQREIPRMVWEAHGISAVRVPGLKVCNLANPRPLSALKLDSQLLVQNDLTVPQACGLLLQRHPSGFQAIRFKKQVQWQAMPGAV